MTMHFGTLYIVATPLGNLKDITQRAIETLQRVDVIAAEDTRHSRTLLSHLGLSKPLVSLRDANERRQTETILARLKKGESVALISDAGTPLISDPGYFFVREAQTAGIHVIPIPGPCALITALCASGLPTDRFIFEGFLPAKQKARENKLSELKNETRTLIFYEAPHRILETLIAMESSWGGDREITLARELTKKFETISRKSIAGHIASMKQYANEQRGEFVVLVEGNPNPSVHSDADKILSILLERLPVKQAADIASKITGEKKNSLYRRAVQLTQH